MSTRSWTVEIASWRSGYGFMDAGGVVASHLAFNAVVSFASHIDWLGYAAERAMGYLLQMTSPTVQNVCAAAAGIALPTAELLDWCVARPELSLIYLTAVLFSVATWRLGPPIFASITSVPTYNFFFIPPLYSLHPPLSIARRTRPMPGAYGACGTASGQAHRPKP